MKHYYLLFIFYISVLLSSTSSNAQEIGMEHIPLRWSDFQGQVPADPGLIVAHISYQLGYAYTKTSTYHKIDHTKSETTFILNKKRSWVDRSTLKRVSNATKNELLNHEKGHFIIGLIYYKNLKDRVTNNNYQNHPKGISFFYKQFNTEINKANDEYDLATNHGRNSEIQGKWNKNLLKQLNDLYSIQEMSHVVHGTGSY